MQAKLNNKMQKAMISIDIRGKSILKTKLAIKDVMHIPTTIIQRRVINHEILSMSSFSTEVFSDMGRKRGQATFGIFEK